VNESRRRSNVVLLIADLEIVDKHHIFFTKYEEMEEEMYDAALLSSVRLSNPSQGTATQLAAMLAAILL